MRIAIVWLMEAKCVKIRSNHPMNLAFNDAV